MAYVNLGQVIYPIGAVYISYTNMSPANLFGGNWTAITGRFPYFNAGNGTGGANSVSHNHARGSLVACIGAVNSDTGTLGYVPSTAPSYKYIMGIRGPSIAASGISHVNHGTVIDGKTDNSTTNNMPAYQTLYAWRRTS